MMENETYKKIPWVYEMSFIFQNNAVSGARLDCLADDEQKEFVYAVISTLSQYFAQIPNHNADISKADCNYSEKFVESLSNTLPVWLNGLCDLSVTQVINGLMDILNLKTEYQKWPPKSVMEFYAVCKKSRPAYHDIKKSNSLLEIGFDDTKLRKKSESVAEKSMVEIFKMLGKDYAKIKDARDREKKLAF